MRRRGILSRTSRMRCLALIVLALVSRMPQAEPKVEPVVLDASTVGIGAERIPLRGVHSPRLDQVCVADAAEWRCGDMAAGALRSFVGARPIRCEPPEEGGTSPGTAVCRVGDVELNRWLLSEGWAFAAPGAPESYWQAEREAVEAGRGIWRGGFSPSAGWRLRASEGARPGEAEVCSVCAMRHRAFNRQRSEEE